MSAANRPAGRTREPVDNSLRSPRYIQAYAAIRDWIYQGTYKPGQRLPTEGELCDLFGVSRITTRKAVDMLVDEELVVRQPGLEPWSVRMTQLGSTTWAADVKPRKGGEAGTLTLVVKATDSKGGANASTFRMVLE